MNCPYSNRVLIVEDDQDLRQTLALRFESLGFDTSCASDGLEGLQQASELHPGVIIMDITLPTEDGIATCRKMSELAELSATPIIFHSGNDLEKLSREIHGLGGVYVQKGPDSWEEIRSLLELFGLVESSVS